MLRRHSIGVSAAILLSLSTSVLASSFVVRDIKIQGLQRVSTSTVMHSMPLHVGQTYTPDEGNAIIAALFRTGFFSDVQLQRRNNTLMIQVVERPTIDSIHITGNKSIKADLLKPILKKLGIVVGYTFDPSQLHAIVLGLQQQYAMLGHAGAIVKPTVTTLSRNRVSISIVIQEGKASIVRGIQFVGNHAFSEHVLLSQFKLTTPSVFTWFNHNDRYSSMRLDADLQNLQNFYMNHGYLDFQVLSHNVVTLPNGKGVKIQVNVSEGSVYHISGYSLDAGKLPSSLKPKINELLSEIKTGAVFSRQEVLDINQKIGDHLADHGYAFPQINPTPELDHATHHVFIHYHIQSGHRVYVRHINLAGNTRTSGLVVRSQLRQMEGSLYSLKDIKESKRRIANLSYLDKIEVETKPVPSKNNQVDLNYHVHEVSAGRASVQAGYSDVDGFLYGANVSEPNFMGSGKFVSLGFQRSAYTSSYGFNYNNPFFTVNGVSQGYAVYYSHTTPANVNLEPYTMDDYGASTTYGIPISEYDQFMVGGGYDHIAIANVNYSLVSPSVTQFLTANPTPYNQGKIITGISHATLDRAIFPTSGNEQGLNLTLGAPVSKSSLGYYQTSYDLRWYMPLVYGFIFNPHATLAYGGGYGSTKQLPFFNNYYAGGLQTLPGYEANTLGPKNPVNTSQALGGNLETLGGLNLILPDFISNKVRTAMILDAGNIFQTNHVAGISYENVSFNNLRVTTGIMVSWWSPLGAPLDFSLAVPLNKKPGDQLSIFGFSFGATL